MKGLTTLAFFAFLYLLIIIIFNEAAGEPRGVANEDNEAEVTTAVESDLDQPESQDQGGSPKSGTKNQPGVPSSIGGEAKFGNVAKTGEHLSSSQKEDANKDAKKQAAASKQTATVRAADDPSNPINETNPLADIFQVTDPNMRQAMNAIYGAYRGNDQCSRKAFCMMGNYMKDMPGRDIIFLMMGNYIPKEFSLYYEIFKVAVLYGQNCNVYVCIPGPDPNDQNAASAALPKSGPVGSQSPSANTIPLGGPR